MSGLFDGIYEHEFYCDEENEIEAPYLQARTHGCSCCSYEERVTKARLIEHISRLKTDIEQAERFLMQFFVIYRRCCPEK